MRKISPRASFETTNAVALTLITFLGGCTLLNDKLDMSGDDVTDRIEMHAGTSWIMEPPDKAVPVSDADKIRHKYVYGKELFLTPSAFEGGIGLRVELVLVNQSLNCQSQPLEPDAPNPRKIARIYFPCVKEIKDVSSLVATNSEPLKNCLAIWSSLGGDPTRANLIGVIEERYCAFVSVLETRECGPDCPPAQQKKAQPTYINRDSIGVAIVDLRGGGGTAGAIVGGPRPQFRAPPTGDSSPVSAPTK